eukprot:15875220-Heterocapsa_arctica.AAC.1
MSLTSGYLPLAPCVHVARPRYQPPPPGGEDNSACASALPAAKTFRTSMIRSKLYLSAFIVAVSGRS